MRLFLAVPFENLLRYVIYRMLPASVTQHCEPRLLINKSSKGARRSLSSSILDMGTNISHDENTFKTVVKICFSV